MAAAAPTELALAITAARKRAGSHDKLVAILRDRYGLEKASRTLAINWEKGAVPTGGYRDALIKLGVEPALFEPLDPVVFQPAPVAIMQEALENQREMKARLEELGDALANLERGQAELLRRLPVQKVARPKRVSAAPKRR